MLELCILYGWLSTLCNMAWRGTGLQSTHLKILNTFKIDKIPAWRERERGIKWIWKAEPGELEKCWFYRSLVIEANGCHFMLRKNFIAQLFVWDSFFLEICLIICYCELDRSTLCGRPLIILLYFRIFFPFFSAYYLASKIWITWLSFPDFLW